MPLSLKSRVRSKKTVYTVPWFRLVKKRVAPSSEDYYSVELKDYTTVFARTRKGEVLLVKQYRPAPERVTIELPSGQVDQGESPVQAAKRELLEETGYTADKLVLLGTPLLPDTGRLGNRMWCFFAANARPAPGSRVEKGISRLVCDESKFMKMVKNGSFNHALNLAVIFMAAAHGHWKIPHGRKNKSS